jgi:phosphatidylserine/phosphatidylglycerophosphate/cardiolipin synthase-like enzyme
LNTQDYYLATVAKAFKCYFSDFLKVVPKNSIQVYDWHGSESMGVDTMHHKIISFGESLNDPFLVGSSNLDAQSLNFDSEDILLMQNSTLKKDFNAMLKNDFEQPSTIKLNADYFDNQNLKTNFKGCTFKYLRPLL